jgi:uncharacterized cupredoxin-like copper-binding protein
MKKTLSALFLGLLPVFVLAAGSHSGEHTMADMGHAATSSAVGKAGDPAKVSRTIAMSMDDNMRFTPSQVSVKAGETVRFFVKNSGKMAHEMVIGSMAELKSHAAMMLQMPGMKHAESNMITLQAGQRGGIVWQFDTAGEVDFACLLPGHMEAGMVGKVAVE